jgi:hypothetical protein
MTVAEAKALHGWVWQLLVMIAMILVIDRFPCFVGVVCGLGCSICYYIGRATR